MRQHIITSQLLSESLAVALVASYLIVNVKADNGRGTDAPGTNTNSGPTTAYNEAGASGSNGGLSVTAQIAIGVVVGVIGLGAIAGGIVFFFRRKKMWDEKIKRYETINAYHNAQREAKKQQVMSHNQQRRQRQQERDAERGMLEISTLPKGHARDSVIPNYDPSTFHKHQYSLDSSRGLSIDMPREPLISQHHRHSSSVSNTNSAVPPPLPLQKSASKRYKGFGSYSGQVTTTVLGQSGNKSSEVQPSSDTQGKSQGPKKPKPALTRLITNL